MHVAHPLTADLRNDVLGEKALQVLFGFFDHRPDFTAQNAVQSSANVEIDSPCFASLPVCSAISLSASCFGFVTGPRVFSFLRRTRWPSDAISQTWK